MQISTTKEPLNDRSISPHFRDSKKIKNCSIHVLCGQL